MNLNRSVSKWVYDEHNIVQAEITLKPVGTVHSLTSASCRSRVSAVAGKTACLDMTCNNARVIGNCR